MKAERKPKRTVERQGFMVRLSAKALKFIDTAAQEQRRSRTQVIEDLCEVVAESFAEMEAERDPFSALDLMGHALASKIIERGYASAMVRGAWEIEREDRWRERVEVEQDRRERGKGRGHE